MKLNELRGMYYMVMVIMAPFFVFSVPWSSTITSTIFGVEENTMRGSVHAMAQLSCSCLGKGWRMAEGRNILLFLCSVNGSDKENIQSDDMEEYYRHVSPDKILFSLFLFRSFVLFLNFSFTFASRGKEKWKWKAWVVV